MASFHRASAARDGHRPECKACTAVRRKRWYEANRAREIPRVTEWQRANPDLVRASRARAKADGRRQAQDRRSYLKRTYGITVEQYDEMLASQGGVCAVCGREPRDDISLHVDHDHETGAIRGLLCFRCNNSLGDLGDDPDLLRRAAAYIEAFDPEMIGSARLVRERVAALRR